MTIAPIGSSSQETVTWVGIDEAGYGPNLGPLVVTATVWESFQSDCLAPSGGATNPATSLFDPEDLWYRLSPVVRPCSGLLGEGVVVDDSKKLYSTARGLGRLERGVLSLVAARGPLPRSFSSLLGEVGADETFSSHSPPWYVNRDVPLPTAVEPAEVHELAARIVGKMERCGLWLRAIHSHVVLPARFNALVAKHDSKGAVLAEATSDLLHRALAVPSQATSPVFPQGSTGTLGPSAVALVDRHGGRKNYRPLLQQAFPEDLVVCMHETRMSSRYRMRANGRPVEVCFQTGAEQHLPVALASMVSKYVRELAMLLFNRFWSEHVPNLRPTAGYPVDARRFAAEIQAQQQQLGIANEVLWRTR